MSASSGKMLGHHGFAPPGLRPDYKSYRSPHAPQYTISPNFHGINLNRASKFAVTAGLFAGAGGIAAIFFFSDIPKVRRDVMQKLPIIGDYFVREIPPEDNPF